LNFKGLNQVTSSHAGEMTIKNQQSWE